jgi:predicted DNA-binding transcriptional regulator AlpA
MNTSPTPHSKRALTEREAAEYIGMSRSFLRQARMNGDREGRAPGPRFIRVGTRAIRYLREDLDAWIDQWRSGQAARLRGNREQI